MNSQSQKAALFYTVGEEVANAVSHGVGAIGGVVGLVMMLLKSDSLTGVISAAIYGASLIVMFTISCLYHALTNKKAKQIFRVFDHLSIFLLIAGTYTPYTLVTLQGTVGWMLFAIVWSAAVVGIILNVVDLERFKKFSMICYVAAGWCVVFAIVPLLKALDIVGFIWLLLGGVMYTVGIAFYRQKQRRGFHAVWHMFVLAAAVCQFISIYVYVL